jgi:hypothetical protein
MPTGEGGGVAYETDLLFMGSASERTTKLTSMLESTRTCLVEKSAGLPEALVAQMKARCKLRGAAE